MIERKERLRENDRERGERERERTVDTRKHELILDSTRDIKNPKSKHQKEQG